MILELGFVNQLKLLSQRVEQNMKRYWRLQDELWKLLHFAKKLHHWKHKSTLWILQSHGRIRSEVSNPTYLQIPIWSAFLTIQGCSMIFWRESLFEESFTRSCTYFHIMYSERQLNLLTDSISLHPDINIKQSLTNLPEEWDLWLLQKHKEWKGSSGQPSLSWCSQTKLTTYI